MQDKILLYILRHQVVLYSSLPVGHKCMDSYKDEDMVDAFTRDVQTLRYSAPLNILKIKLFQQNYKIFQKVQSQLSHYQSFWE